MPMTRWGFRLPNPARKRLQGVHLPARDLCTRAGLEEERRPRLRVPPPFLRSSAKNGAPPDAKRDPGSGPCPLA